MTKEQEKIELAMENSDDMLINLREITGVENILLADTVLNILEKAVEVNRMLARLRYAINH